LESVAPGVQLKCPALDSLENSCTNSMFQPAERQFNALSCDIGHAAKICGNFYVGRIVRMNDVIPALELQCFFRSREHANECGLLE